MGKGQGISEIILLFLVKAELNFVLEKKGLGIDKGMIFLTENNSTAIFFQTLLKKAGAVEVKNLTSIQPVGRNYQLLFHQYNRYEKSENIQQFLCNRKFIPAIIVQGAIPENLQGLAFAIEINEEDVFAINQEELGKEIEETRNFIRLNPEVILHELDCLKSSEIFLNRRLDSLLFNNLGAAANSYLLYFRNSHTESETLEKQKRMYEEIEYCVGRTEILSEEYDIIDTIRAATNRYFDNNEGYIIVDIEKVGGEAVKAVKESKVVLYDKKFYYISEPLFRKACSVLLDIVSFIKIKKILRDEKVITCNQTENDSFTIKKVFINVYGVPCRERFLKFEKEFFVNEEGLNLEERKGGEENAAVFGTNNSRHLSE